MLYWLYRGTEGDIGCRDYLGFPYQTSTKHFDIPKVSLTPTLACHLYAFKIVMSNFQAGSFAPPNL